MGVGVSKLSRTPLLAKIYSAEGVFDKFLSWDRNWPIKSTLVKEKSISLI
jgi:hypothetical protein